MMRLGCILCKTTGVPLYPYQFKTLLGRQYEVYFCLNCNQTVMTAIRKGTPAYTINLNSELEFTVKKLNREET